MLTASFVAIQVTHLSFIFLIYILEEKKSWHEVFLDKFQNTVLKFQESLPRIGCAENTVFRTLLPCDISLYRARYVNKITRVVRLIRRSLEFMGWRYVAGYNDALDAE